MSDLIDRASKVRAEPWTRRFTGETPSVALKITDDDYVELTICGLCGEVLVWNGSPEDAADLTFETCVETYKELVTDMASWPVDALREEP